MDYNRIVAVTGLPGLYEVLSSKADGAIVRSLEDQSTKFVASRVHNLSHLESIEVYTTRENVTLADVFNSMKENKGALPDVKDNKALQDYFKRVYPEMDFDRVYASDMKKMVKWFEVLEANQVDYNAKPEEAEEEEEEKVEVEVEAEAPKKPKAKKEEPAPAKAPVEKTAEKKAPAKATKKAAPKAATKEAAPKKAAAKKKK